MSARRPTRIRRSSDRGPSPYTHSFYTDGRSRRTQGASQDHGRGQSMSASVFPVRLDNEGYRGRAAALWLFGLFLLLRLIMGVNGAINTSTIAAGDGLRLDQGGADTILLLFRNLSL